jgi:hypothetical protein
MRHHFSLLQGFSFGGHDGGTRGLLHSGVPGNGRNLMVSGLAYLGSKSINQWRYG